MNPALSPDDLPPPTLTVDDYQIRRELDGLLMQRFERQCKPLIQQLLQRCDWYIASTYNVVTLVIDCPNSTLNWQLLQQVPSLSATLGQFSQDAKIRVCPPAGTGTPFEIRVDERSIYQDSE